MTNLSNKEQAILWGEAARRLLMIKLKLSVPTELVNRLQSQLPAKQAKETFSEYIRRSSIESQAKHKNKLEHKIVDITSKYFSPLSEFVRLAADSSGSEISLPDPDCDLESVDGRFRLKVSLVNGRVKIIIQALGFASDEFAGRRIAIANPANNNQPVAVIELDQDGDGDCIVEDSNEVRRALLNPALVLVKDN